MGTREKIKDASIYIHFPFCRKKCPYCDFSSISIKNIPEMQYIDSILKELSQVLKKEELGRVKTLYLGGGTPSLFSPRSIDALMQGIFKKLPPLKNPIEITMEANPDTIEAVRLKDLRLAGVNRLSIGVESFNDKLLLETLKRTHNAEKARWAYSMARRAGFENIAIDLMFAIPGQTMEDWQSSVSEAIELRPQHISIYGLKAEENTPYYEWFRDGKLSPVEEELYVRMYETAIGLLKDNGYIHYEISNLALNNFQSRHNTAYWSGENYIGLGSSAHSYLNHPAWGRRWWNEPDPYRYMELLDKGKNPIKGSETLGKKEALLENTFLTLRLIKGINKGSFKGRWGVLPEDVLDWERLTALGLVCCSDERVLLTQKGIIFSSEVF